MAYKVGRQINESEWVTPIDRLRDDVTTLFVKIDGFTDDVDNDGVSDAFDKSPNTPLGVAVDGSGNALDVDMDNVPDYRDADPFSNRGVLVDENGIELDDDKDGVPNSKDLESNTPVGTMVNQFGINISNTTFNNSGGLTYFPSIYFNSGSAVVGSSNENRIATMALLLRNNQDINLNVIGHTDNVGNTKFNRELGLKRANEVISYLVSNYKIDADRLNAITKGEEAPLSVFTAINNGLEGNVEVNTLAEINRRVDFEIAY
jgi:OOP family OmpA-OmpF porin